MLKLLFASTIFIWSFTYSFADYNQDKLISDYLVPLETEPSKKILFWGGGITAGLILFRDQIVEPIHEDFSEDKPLGEASKYGDLLGQLVPNALYLGYMGYQSKFNNDATSGRRFNLMLKTTLFAGFNTFYLKRVINQRRPHKGDRLSFPSGHTTTGFAFASVFSLEHPEYAWLGYGVGTLVGLSRINDNAHYLHDVVMGATLGMAYGFGFYYKDNKKSDDNDAITCLPLSNDGMYVNYLVRF